MLTRCPAIARRLDVSAWQRIDSTRAPASDCGHRRGSGQGTMKRFIFVIFLLLLPASVASAQQDRQDPGCARDVARHCRAVMNDGDSAVLACLKQNRARLSKTCEKVLTDHGQ
jgi:hypothetical protein